MADGMNGAARQTLDALYEAAHRTAHPAICLPAHLPPIPANGRIIIIGAGKGSAAMAVATEEHYIAAGQGDKISGLISTRHGFGLPTKIIEILEAGHPVPDANSIEGAKRAIALAKSAGPNDLVLCLLSGGASAIWSAPVDGVSFEAKQQLTKQLLEVRRADLRDELRAQASVANQRRQARRRRASGPPADARHFRRAGRPSRRDRLRPDRRRPLDARGCARRARAMEHHARARNRSGAERPGERNSESRRPEARNVRLSHRRRAEGVARGRRDDCARARLSRRHSGRHARRRGARRRRSFHAALALDAKTTRREGRDHVGRRTDRHRPWQRLRRTQPGVRPRARHRARRRTRYLRPRRRHRRHRRRRRQRRRSCRGAGLSGHPDACRMRSISMPPSSWTTTILRASSGPSAISILCGPTQTNVNDFRVILVDP